MLKNSCFFILSDRNSCVHYIFSRTRSFLLKRKRFHLGEYIKEERFSRATKKISGKLMPFCLRWLQGTFDLCLPSFLVKSLLLLRIVLDYSFQISVFIPRICLSPLTSLEGGWRNWNLMKNLNSFNQDWRHKMCLIPSTVCFEVALSGFHLSWSYQYKHCLQSKSQRWEF